MPNAVAVSPTDHPAGLPPATMMASASACVYSSPLIACTERSFPSRPSSGLSRGDSYEDHHYVGQQSRWLPLESERVLFRLRASTMPDPRWSIN